MQCTYCGSEVSSGSRFCPHCGQLVNQSPSAAASSPAVDAARTLSERPVPSQAMSGVPTADVQGHALAEAHGNLAGQASTETAATPSYRVLLEFSDGSQVLLDADAVIGRKPEQAALQEDLIAVPLVDPLKSASRVHLRLYMTPQGVNVVDSASGNGTRVEHDGHMYECQAYQPFWIEPGDRLWLGEVPIGVSLG